MKIVGENTSIVDPPSFPLCVVALFPVFFFFFLFGVVFAFASNILK